jgi:hypothetical protein
MKGVSAVVAIVLILMIGISMTGLGYVTFTTFFNQMTTSTQGAISNTLTNMLAQMKIESVTNLSDNSKTLIYIRNTGKVDLTNFSAYDDEVMSTIDKPPGDKISSGSVGNLNMTVQVQQGSVIKITTAQGAIAIQTKP